jgi:hypothetical protein
LVDNHSVAPQDDEVILCVRYTTGGGYAGLLVLIAVWFCWGFYILVLQGDYLGAAVVAPGCLMMLGVAASNLFFKHLLFYRDRIVKVWHLFGQRTVSYSRAKMCVNTWIRPRILPYGKPFSVKETDSTGRVRLIQTSIAFGSVFVSPDTGDKVESIMSYLVGEEDKSKLYEESRIFVRSALPKDILCQDQEKTYNSWLGLKL